MLGHLLAFSALAAVLVAIPGPAVILVMKNATLYGRRTAMLTGVGVFSGDLVWISASVTGLTALLVTSQPAFEALRYIGAAYLVYLGLRLLLRGGHAPSPTEAETATARAHSRTRRRVYAEGALCELTNPKTLLVFTGVIPQFVSNSAGALELTVFGALFAVLGLLSLLTYAGVVGSAHRRIRSSKLASALTRIAGAVLAAFGLDLAVDPTG